MGAYVYQMPAWTLEERARDPGSYLAAPGFSPLESHECVPGVTFFF